MIPKEWTTNSHAHRISVVLSFLMNDIKCLIRCHPFSNFFSLRQVLGLRHFNDTYAFAT